MKLWTTEPPTEPGWYWIISTYTAKQEPRLIHIWRYEDPKLGKRLFTNEDGGAPLNDKMLYPKGTLFSSVPVVAPRLEPIQDSYLRNCIIKLNPKDSEECIALFEQIGDKIICRLDSYAIIPIEEYKKLTQ